MSMTIDPRASDLIEALKIDEKKFILSNLIFKNHNALRAVYEYYSLMADLLEFAKDPQAGMDILGPEPEKPSHEKLQSLSERDKQRALADYETMLKMYNDRKKALEMHVPYHDYLMIQNYMEKFEMTMHATPAVKGLRFKAFTKDVERQEQGILSGLFKRGSNQQ